MVTVAESTQDAYDRGVTAGEIAAQLKDHAAHLAKINGSVDRTADELATLRVEFTSSVETLTLAVQRLADQAEADARTRVATAAALKEAEDKRLGVAEQRWTPVAKSLAVMAAFVGVVGLFITLYLATR